MTNEQIRRIYNTKMQNLMNKNARIRQEQDDADRTAWQEKQAANARTSAKLSLLGMYKDLKESHEMGLVSATYDDPGMGGVPPKKFEKPDPRSFGEMWEDIGTGENIKRGIQNILPGRLGAYRETEGYKQFKAKEDAPVEAVEEVAAEVAPLTLSTGKIVKDPSAEFDADVIREALKTAESGSQEKFELTQQLDYIKTFSPEELEELKQQDVSAEFVDPVTGESLPVNGEISPTTPAEPDVAIVPDAQTIPDATIDQPLDIQVPGATPEVSADPKRLTMNWVEDLTVHDTDKYSTEDLQSVKKYIQENMRTQANLTHLELDEVNELLTERAAMPKARRITEFDPMGDVDLDVSPELEGAPDIMMESPQLKGAEGAPITATVPDAKPDGKYVGKALGALQTLKSMTDIGKTLTNEEASGADKAIAGTQGVKMLADMAAKKAGQKTAVEAVKAGTKIGGKAAVGAAAGGVIGGYTAVTEAKEAGEAWEEKDYDEAILHGMGSASGMFQTAGAGMMLSGVGAPLGAVIYGIGTAGSVISSAGLMLEGLFGGGDEPEPEKPKFNASRYLDSIRKQRRYN